VHLAQKGIKVGHRSEIFHDVPIVADVIPVVVVGRGVDGIEPDDIHPEAFDIIQFGKDAFQVANAVAVRILEATGIDLVNDCFLPPFPVFGSGIAAGRICTTRGMPTAAGTQQTDRYAHCDEFLHCLFLILFRKMNTELNPDQRHAGKKRHPQPSCLRFNGAVNKKKGADNRIKQPPDNIYQSGRQALPGRFCKRRGESITAYPLDKMRNSIGKKNASEECAEVELPDHLYSFL
jgi:hypothetical protein